MKLISIGKFARKLGISVNTLRRMHTTNELISLCLRYSRTN